MLSVSIKISGDKETQARVRRLGSSLYDLKNAMNTIGKELVKYYSGQAFASHGGVFGKPWPALSAITLAHRGIDVELTDREDRFVGFLKSKDKEEPTLAGSRNADPLVSGKPNGMRDSFQYAAGLNQVIITNSKPYFKYHQSSRPRKVIPRRQMMGVNDPVKRMAQNAIRSEINRKLERA
jgi:hypothetical protein